MRSVHHCLYATALITRSIADSNVRCINSKRQLEFGNGTSCETHWTIRYSLSHVANTLTQGLYPLQMPTLKLFLPMATCSGSVAMALPSTSWHTSINPLHGNTQTTGNTLTGSTHYWLYMCTGSITLANTC